MPSADLHSRSPERIEVQTNFNEKELIKLIPGSRWDGENRLWTVPRTWTACCQLRGVFRDSLIIGPALLAWAREKRFSTDGVIELRERIEPKTRIDEKLYPFQEAGIEFLNVAGDSLLGDTMGLGKTIQTLKSLELPALVICPNTVKHNWVDEAAKWLPKATPYLIHGSALQRRKLLTQAQADPTALVIMNIEGVRGHSRLAPYGSIRLKRCAKCDPKLGDPKLTDTRCEVHPKELNGFGFKTVVFDEAHRLKDPRSLQARAAWACAHGPTVNRRIALTGTPIANDPSDLWSIMHFLAPKDFPTKSKFIDRYCTPPDSMVWMADGTFKRIGDVVVGDLVMGFSKEPISGKGKHPHYEATQVLAVNRRRADLVRVYTNQGDSFVCTPDHRWLTGYRRLRSNGPRIAQFSEPITGMTMRHVVTVPPPLPDELREDAAWLGGLYDGEGTHTRIAQSRIANPDVHAKIGQVLQNLGLSHRMDDNGYYLLGGRDTYFKFVQWCRPVKRYLASKSDRYPWAEYLFRGSISGTGRPSEVTVSHIEPEGHGEVVSLTTELQTYIVHGYASHNCLQSWNSYGGLSVVGVLPENRVEFDSIINPFFRRMTKDLVGLQLPPKIRRIVKVEMGAKQAKAYHELGDDLVTRLDDGQLLIAPTNLAAHTRLIQLASSYCELDDDGRVTLCEPSPKLDALEELIDELGAGRQAVVCAVSRQLIELASKRFTKSGVKHGLITGKVDQWDRKKALQDLNEGRIQVLLFTIQAGSTGLNMTAADTIIYLQRSGSMVDNCQSEDRVHRIGSERHETVQVIDIITQDTIESTVLSRYVEKLQRLDEITRDRERQRAAGVATTDLDELENLIMNSNLGVPS